MSPCQVTPSSVPEEKKDASTVPPTIVSFAKKSAERVPMTEGSNTLPVFSMVPVRVRVPPVPKIRSTLSES